ncbi:peptidase inhibitor family I36 protein [Streptomyces sp. NBC_01506]|uniref:peptidase inhibitor family I36 protein n=1 Tax=Streptomyces sp. NBC_01506 TaxID=2903887 RepID=UPI00386C4C7A
MRKIRTAVAGLTIGAALAFTGLAGTAQAGPTADQGVRATFENRSIDLAGGWQGAEACAVFAQDDIRCYGTTEAADRASGYDRAADPLAARADERGARAIPACANGWVCLYEHTNGGGRRLIFNDEYWHNLDNHGFNDQTSSWRNNQSGGDSASLAQHTDASGTRVTLSANSYASSLGSFDNKASAVHG